jgi:hypothetical protein
VPALEETIVFLSDDPARRIQLRELDFVGQLSERKFRRRETNHQTPLEGAIQRSLPGDYHPVQRLGHSAQELVSSSILHNSDWRHMDRSHLFGLNAEPTAQE